ncbi:MAG: gliding motility-associated C-terminal domain-containing protein [Bacteroidota bacterium]
MFPTFCKAQVNLVPNPSFEDTVYCPQGLADIGAVANWDSPTLGTPDYYNNCSFTSAGVPLNNYGYEPAHAGNAYTGIVTNTYNTITNGREYLQAHLMQKLEAEFLYKISFYVSFSDSCLNAANNMGVYFSDTHLLFPTLIEALPVTNFLYKTEIITKASGWQLLEYYYLANGSENYIILGNFYSNANTHFQTVNLGVSIVQETYYYIDDVSVEKVDWVIPNVCTPNNDGINDEWVINNLPADTQVQVYNKWGTLVNEAVVQNYYAWDGRTKAGLACTDGIYYYVITDKNKKSTITKGFVQLLR